MLMTKTPISPMVTFRALAVDFGLLSRSFYRWVLEVTGRSQ